MAFGLPRGARVDVEHEFSTIIIIAWLFLMVGIIGTYYDMVFGNYSEEDDQVFQEIENDFLTEL